MPITAGNGSSNENTWKIKLKKKTQNLKDFGHGPTHNFLSTFSTSYPHWPAKKNFMIKHHIIATHPLQL